ncbi:MAG: hypothetical protein IKC11_06355 [Clostridia bacterium]|nr:hypothetical protein [Clostridia bacterium]
MKNLKTKIFSLIICICMCLSFFTGCSLFVKKDTVDKTATALKIGDTVITKQELIDSYYSFYQQNYYYFMYYDEETIMNVFYDSVIAREVVLAEANKMLAENPKFFSAEDMEDVWNDVFDYVYGQIDAKEKSLLLLVDADEENLPERLHEHNHDEEEKAYKYEPYEFEAVVEKDYSADTAAPEVDIDQKIVELKDGIYTYNAAVHEEDERDMKPIADEEKAVRTQAFDMYIADLILSAKANKKASGKEAVLKAEIKRIYESYYENALYNKYQEYIESTAAGSGDGEFENKFTDSAIAEKYKKLLKADKESNTLEDNYVSVIESSDNDSLILYHHNGKYTYFTVQHVLVSFDDETLDALKATEGYDTAKDKIFRDYYEQVRETYVDYDNMKTTYRGEDGLVVDVNEDDKIDENDEVSINYILDKFEDDFDAIDTTGMTAEEKVRARTMLFNKYAWTYSGDTGSLTNEKLSGVLGFTISSQTDEHGSFVKDFTNGARSLYEAYLQDKSANNIGETILPVVSDYGVHLMMLTGVYEAGAVVDIQGKSDAEIVAELKTKYVSNLTEQTLYEYFYDMLKEELVGESGTYFTDYRNSLVKSYEESNLIKEVDKMSYDELQDAIN